MSLVYKSSVRENITDLQTYIVDTTPTSTKYFRVSDVPQVLQKGKNLLRITAHPTNLVPGSQIFVDVRDSNGNPIYYEIPDYPSEYNECTVVARLIDGLGFRYYWATEGLRDEDLAFTTTKVRITHQMVKQSLHSLVLLMWMKMVTYCQKNIVVR